MDGVNATPPHPTQTDNAPTAAESSDLTSSAEHNSYERNIAPHDVVRLVQCHHCSRPLRAPCRLPCGKTVCRECLPPSRPRTGITYPLAEGREEGFTCYWKDEESCVGEHCIGDCGTDVVLCSVLGVFQEELMGETPCAEAHNDLEGDSRIIHWTCAGASPSIQGAQNARISQNGWLHGLYQLALDGQLPHDATEFVYEDPSRSDSSVQHQGLVEEDRARFQKLRNRLRSELDCQVCYALILDPLSLPCGHTFCRQCVARVLDHSDLCPICRRNLGMPTAIQSEPTNSTLALVIDYFFALQLEARRVAAAQDEMGADHENLLPLFVCTLSFPTMPTFLHIFEPRYRLMIRRVVDNGGGKFGMVMYNRRGRSQGDELGRIPFMQYGTLLMVERYELLPDGRSLVIATGVSRFKVIESSLLDGYHVAKTERVDDIALAEEEQVESTETAAATIAHPSEDDNPETPLDSMSTQDLLTLCRTFIQYQRQAGAPWLHPRVMLAYGPAPTDAARFPWWFASILPIAEEEKYPILSSVSVRERLKLSARWTREFESRDWFVPSLNFYKFGRLIVPPGPLVHHLLLSCD